MNTRRLPAFVESINATGFFEFGELCHYKILFSRRHLHISDVKSSPRRVRRRLSAIGVRRGA